MGTSWNYSNLCHPQGLEIEDFQGWFSGRASSAMLLIGVVVERKAKRKHAVFGVGIERKVRWKHAFFGVFGE